MEKEEILNEFKDQFSTILNKEQEALELWTGYLDKKAQCVNVEFFLYLSYSCLHAAWLVLWSQIAIKQGDLEGNKSTLKTYREVVANIKEKASTIPGNNDLPTRK